MKLKAGIIKINWLVICSYILIAISFLVGFVSGGELRFLPKLSLMFIKDYLKELFWLHLMFFLPIVMLNIILLWKSHSKILSIFKHIIIFWILGFFYGFIIDPILHKFIHLLLGR